MPENVTAPQFFMSGAVGFWHSITDPFCCAQNPLSMLGAAVPSCCTYHGYCMLTSRLALCTDVSVSPM